MKLSVIVPCHNEAENLKLVFERFRAVAEQYPLEVIMVNNASRDTSAQIFAALLQKPDYAFIRVVEEPTPGYGLAILTGLRVATGEVLAWTHADLQTDPMDIVRGLELFEKAPDRDRLIVKGTRVARPFGAWLFTLGMTIIASLVLQGRYTDVNAQPKLFSRSFFEQELRDPPQDFSLDLYLLVVARRKGYRILTFPVFFSKRLHGESAWAFSFQSRLKTTLRTIKYIFALRASRVPQR